MANSKKTMKPGRYLILLKNNAKRTVKKVENELQVSLTSAVELNSKVRSFDVFNSGNGIIFKNLDIAIVDNVSADHLTQYCAASSSPVIHWEEDMPMQLMNEFKLIDDLKEHNALMQKKIKELEHLLLKPIEDDSKIVPSFTWGLKSTGVGTSKLSGKGIDICILDTGFYLDHPDFLGRNIQGRSYIEGEKWDFDGNGHGTHCAGTAAGNISKIDGLQYGIAKGANLHIYKVLSDTGNGSSSIIADAIDKAIEDKCDIVSMSLGSPVSIGDEPSPLFEHIGRKALENNCLIIAAAGNDSKRPNIPRPVSSPANAETIMAVAAIKENLLVANFSNGGINSADGGRIDISGPGVNIYSSYSKNAANGALYKNLSGTSMATPHVAGIAALYKEAMPNLTAAELWLKLEKTAHPLTNQLLRDIGQGQVQIK